MVTHLFQLPDVAEPNFKIELVELAKCEFGSLYGICDQISGAISALSQEGPQITGLRRLTLHLISGLSHICSK